MLLLIMAVITGFMLYKAREIKLSYAGGKVLPVTDPAFKEYQLFKQKFGEDGSVMVIGVESDKIFTKDFFNAWQALGDSILDHEGIREVVSIGRTFNLVKDTSEKKFRLVPLVPKGPLTQEQVDSVKAKLFQLVFYEGLIFNKEKNATLMAITFDKTLLNTDKRLDIVNKILEKGKEFTEKQGIVLHYSGLPYIRTVIAQKVASEFKLFLFLATLIAAVILLFFFKTLYAVLFPILVVTVGVIWSLGTIVLMGYEITLLTGLIPPLIVITGIPNSVLILNKYHNDYRKHRDKIRALMGVIQQIGVTTLLANVTTAIGFGVFYFTNSEILTEFGIVAAVNIMATYACSLILMPVIFSYLPDPTQRHTRHLENKHLQKFINRIDYLVHNYRTRIYWVTGIIVVVSVIGVLKLNINGHMVDDLPQDDPVFVDLKFFESTFDGVLPFEVSIDTRKKNGVMNPSFVQKVEKMQDMLSDYPEFSKALSLNEILKFSTQAFYNGRASRYDLPNQQERNFILSYASRSEGTGRMLDNFLDSSRQETRVSFQMADIGSERMNLLVKELKPRIDSIFAPDRYDVKLTGASMIFLKGNNYLIKHLRESLLLAIALISLLMLILFRNGKMIGISLLPNIIPLIITAALMGYFGISLKPSTILIFSIAFGIASDQTIYFLTKYRQELKYKNWSISKTVSLTLRETGVSMIYTAIILFFGFGIFAASTFGGTVSLGILVSITLLMALVSNLFLLPSLLLTLEKRIRRKAWDDPLIQVFDEEEDIDLNDLTVKNRKP